MVKLCQSMGLQLRFLSNITNDFDFTQLCEHGTTEASKHEVHIVRTVELAAEYRTKLDPSKGHNYIIMHKNDSMPVTGEEPVSFFHKLISRATMDFMDRCGKTSCKNVCNRESVACSKCLGIVCRDCAEYEAVCPLCHRPTNFIRKCRFKMAPFVNMFIIRKLQENRRKLPSNKCANVGCTSPKTHFVCACWVGPHYCSRACQKAHWPQHQKRCWFAPNKCEDTEVRQKLDSLKDATRHMALKVFPRLGEVSDEQVKNIERLGSKTNAFRQEPGWHA
jgi:hypothetical protein